MMRRTLVAAALLALAGCGSGAVHDAATDDDHVSIRSLQLAADNTQQAESTSFEMDVRGEMVDLHATGVASADGKTARIVLDAGPMGQVEERVVDGVLYLDAGGTSALGSGKQWVRLDLDGLGDRLGASGLFGTQTPSSALDVLRQLTGDVQQLGDDTVAGRHATQYRATIERHGTSAPVDVWVDDDDRVVKLHAEMPDGLGEVTMQITGFGVPVDVQAPPPDQVGDLSDLLPGGLFGNLPGIQPNQGHTISVVR
jgi:hypothetical protein